VKDVLETSESADSETITRIITDELKACGLNLVLGRVRLGSIRNKNNWNNPN